MDARAKINWENQESHVLLNPKLPLQELQALQELAQNYAQAGHIWISSSGSSASAQQSVKLIALSKKAFLASAQGVNQHLQASAKDVWVQALPRFHVGGLSIETRAHLSNSQVVAGLDSDKWDPHFFRATIERNQGSLSALVPTQVFDLVRENLKAPSTMRGIVIGGSALAGDLYEQATALGWPLLPSYGLTECCSQVATAPLDCWKVRKTDFQILSHVRAELNPEGILRLQSPALLTGFAQWVNGQMIWKDPKIDGWYQTEDFCEINDGFLKPLGRGSDYVKVSGEGVSLLKLQEILETMARKKVPGQWQHLALAALPDSRAGSVLILAKTSQISEASAQEVIQEFNETVAPFERLKKTLEIGEIPRTSLGKIAREKLKSLLLSRIQ